MRQRVATREDQGLRRALREVASGSPVPDAASHLVEVGAGPQRRAAGWKDLRARRMGMVPELWDLLSGPGVTDVLINGTEVWVDEGRGCHRAEWAPTDETECRALAIQMASAAGKRLDDSSPMVDAFLGETIRLHAAIPPLSRGGTAISLRVLRQRGFPLGRLMDLGSFPPEVGALLRRLVDRGTSVLVSGSTGAGKTTLLAALLSAVPSHHRIICIEEVSELFPDHPHVVHLQERQANIEGAGAISLTQLVRAALRMRPDWLVLGECRGAEVREVLTALNSGHAGMATIHAGSVHDVPARLIALGALAGLEERVIRLHAAAAFQVILQLGRGVDGRRRLQEIGVLTGGDRLRCEVAVDYRTGSAIAGPGIGRLTELTGWTPGDG